MNWKFIFWATVIYNLSSRLDEVGGQDVGELPAGDGDGGDTVTDNTMDSSTAGTVTETSPTVVIDCNAVCQANLAETVSRIDALESQLQTMNMTVLQRIVNLETDYYNVLSEKVTTLEADLNTKISDLNSRLTTEVETGISNKVGEVETRLTENMETLRMEMLDSMNGTRSEVLLAVSRLENGKVQTLLKYNELWRRNFRLLNTTISNIRKRLNQNGGTMLG